MGRCAKQLFELLNNVAILHSQVTSYPEFSSPLDILLDKLQDVEQAIRTNFRRMQKQQPYVEFDPMPSPSLPPILPSLMHSPATIYTSTYTDTTPLNIDHHSSQQQDRVPASIALTCDPVDTASEIPCLVRPPSISTSFDTVILGESDSHVPGRGNNVGSDDVHTKAYSVHNETSTVLPAQNVNIDSHEQAETSICRDGVHHSTSEDAGPIVDAIHDVVNSYPTPDATPGRASSPYHTRSFNGDGSPSASSSHPSEENRSTSNGTTSSTNNEDQIRAEAPIGSRRSTRSSVRKALDSAKPAGNNGQSSQNASKRKRGTRGCEMDGDSVNGEKSMTKRSAMSQPLDPYDLAGTFSKTNIPPKFRGQHWERINIEVGECFETVDENHKIRQLNESETFNALTMCIIKSNTNDVQKRQLDCNDYFLCADYYDIVERVLDQVQRAGPRKAQLQTTFMLGMANILRSFGVEAKEPAPTTTFGNMVKQRIVEFYEVIINKDRTTKLSRDEVQKLCTMRGKQGKFWSALRENFGRAVLLLAPLWTDEQHKIFLPKEAEIICALNERKASAADSFTQDLDYAEQRLVESSAQQNNLTNHAMYDQLEYGLAC